MNGVVFEAGGRGTGSAEIGGICRICQQGNRAVRYQVVTVGQSVPGTPPMPCDHSPVLTPRLEMMVLRFPPASSYSWERVLPRSWSQYRSAGDSLVSVPSPAKGSDGRRGDRVGGGLLRLVTTVTCNEQGVLGARVSVCWAVRAVGWQHCRTGRVAFSSTAPAQRGNGQPSFSRMMEGSGTVGPGWGRSWGRAWCWS